MGIQLLLLLWMLSFFAGALSHHGSAGPTVSPTSAPHVFSRKRHGMPVPTPPNTAFPYISPMDHSPTKARAPNKAMGPFDIAVPPYMTSFKHPSKTLVPGSASSHSISFHKHRDARNRFNIFAPQPSYPNSPPTYSQQGVRPSISPFRYHIQSSTSWDSPSPSPTIRSSNYKMPIFPPSTSPVGSSLMRMKSPPPSPVLTLPPPPPNTDCTSVTCTDPLTYTPPGSPCGCVWPIQVRLLLSVALYKFFPLVSELANEISAGVSLNRSQVRIMGANAASQQLEKTIVLINLIPLEEYFNYTIAFLTYKKFWDKKVSIKSSLFGAYDVLYVRYPGLPPSPPSPPSDIATIDDGPYSGHDNNGRTIKPLGVDVSRRKKDGLGGRMIAVIVLSSVTAFVICMGFVLLLLLKCRCCVHRSEQTPNALVSSAIPSGDAGSMMFESRTSSAALSFSSSVLTHTGTAKTFSLNDMKRATDNFNSSRILGEGGFGLVYGGTLDDGTKVAVKVLKRDDQQGGREFLAEVEMLSRLHHRNLIKLIGICTEDHIRCLVYELVSNGSVESHLFGVDKETAPLDWSARMKIALGAARGLAYLHEDSSPRVIHRDFKSSNILLEHDFTPKVSDFGLARSALDEGNKHISTRVMGTFGYLAPEYAMTGHLLVKSDVYSYGVVLLELLTGRKPVDLSQPPGQENLVAWARPLLTSNEGLYSIIDPTIKSNIPFDSMSKVAAIASMCVQPEVSHRPFMGEVVQALKLVCNEFDETKELGSKTCSQEDLYLDVDSKTSRVSGDLVALSTTDLVRASAGLEGNEFGSFRRHSSSGPFRTERRHFWQRSKGLRPGSG